MKGNHRWTRLPFRKTNLGERRLNRSVNPFRLPEWMRERGVVFCCVQCGAQKWQTFRGFRIPPHQWFRFYDSMVGRVPPTPRCHGLPANYDPPIGA